VLRGKFIAISTCIKESEISPINNLMIQLKHQNKPHPKFTNVRTNKDQGQDQWDWHQKKYKESVKQRLGSLKFNKINKPLVNMTKYRGKRSKLITSKIQKRHNHKY
jgi:hypothetical protein